MKKVLTCMLFAGICLGVLSLSGCTPRNQVPNATKESASTQKKEQFNQITGVIQKLDENLKEIVLADVEQDYIYHYRYTGGTTLSDKYGTSIAMSQVEVGQIVDLTLADENTIESLSISKEAWETSDAIGVKVNRQESKINIKGETYLYTSSLVLTDEGKSISLEELTDQDTVTARGYKAKIYSLTVERGHGYVSLSHYDTYIGGMVAIGNVIQPVTKNMLLTVPEGEYELQIDKDGKMGTKPIVVEKDKETAVDLTNVQIIASKRGVIHFVCDPSDVTITIDGVDHKNQTDFKLDYGPHMISVSAVDYKSFNGTITLKVPYMNLNCSLVKLKSDDASSAETSTSKDDNSAAATTRVIQNSDSTTEASSSTTASSSGTTSSSATTKTPANVETEDKVYVTAPSDVELYYDGVKLGNTPINFTKVTGNHKITLKKSGYITKTYTVSLSNDGKDTYLSFSALKKESD